MCVFSMIGDHYTGKWSPYFPDLTPGPASPFPAPVLPDGSPLPPLQPLFVPPASAAELEALKKEVAEMKELLRKAKIYDEQNNEKDCQKKEKVAILKKMAEHFGISLDDILGK